MILSKEQKIEKLLYEWRDSVDLVEDDISSLVDGHNIIKMQIAKDVNKMKNKFRYLETLIKSY